MPLQIVGLSGTHAGASFPIADAPITLGRNPDNTIVLNSARASRRHAEIRREGGDTVVVDLGSANGTLVNGQRLTAPHRLRPGDTIEIGEESFRFDGPAMDATLIAAPAPVAPPTEAVPQQPEPAPAPPVYHPPPQPQPQPQPQVAPSSAPPKQGGGLRTLLIVLGLVGLVMVLACAGGAFALSRSGALNFNSPTSAAFARDTPVPNQNNTGPLPTRAPVEGGAEWTVLVYLDGDNNLERDAVGDLNEMEMVGSSDEIKIVVQIDRIKGEGVEDDDSNGDWDTTKRYLVERDDDEEQINSTEIEDLGELNMGDPQTLTDFITWGVETYPAQRYALVLWDHGSSWFGIAYDDTSDGKGISLPELQSALKTAQDQTGLERFDLIGFDACLMAQLDVFQTIEPFGNVVVASAELEPNEGWAWDAWLQELNADPTQDAATVADAIVRTYGEFYEDSSDDTPTLSAFDLTRVGELRDNLNALSDAMIGDMGGSYNAIAEARSYVDSYSQPKPQEFNAIDLGHFARLLERQGASGDITGPAEQLAATIDTARIAEWNGGFHSNSTGLSIFFPQLADFYPEFYEQGSPLPQVTSWSDFLKAFHGAGEQVSAPEITNIEVSDTTAGVNNPVTVQGSVQGQDIAYIFFAVGVPGAGESIELTDVDFVYPPGSVPNTSIPPWEDGENNLIQTWDGARWGLSNGSDIVPVLLIPIKYGTNLYAVQGTYSSQQTGEQIDAGIIFEVNQGAASLVTIYGFPRGQQESQPYEISPVAGDTFTPQLRTYAVEDGQPTYQFTDGDTITFGDQPLSAEKIPANSGEYVTGFLVVDVSGQITYNYLDITVDNSGAGTNPNSSTPSTGPGAQAGTLAYSNDDLRFSIDYPDTWETFDTGNSQIYFYNPDQSSATYLSVNVFALEQSPDQANQALIDSFINEIDKEQEVTRSEVDQGQVAGLTGPGLTYAYTDDDGNVQSGFAIVVTSPDSGLSYFITGQALAADFSDDVNLLATIASTMTVR